jgi:hypothetical protein
MQWRSIPNTSATDLLSTKNAELVLQCGEAGKAVGQLWAFPKSETD